MSIRFTKMQGLGNDFVVIDATRNPVELSPSLIRLMGDRHYGIGFDQLLLLEPAPHSSVDFSYRIFNADGSEVAQCGNGARCIGRYIHDHGLSDKTDLTVATLTGQLHIRLEPDSQVTVNMGVPNFEPNKIPFSAPEAAPYYELETTQGITEIGAVSVGNPHAVLQVEDVSQAPVKELGAEIESHPRFPARTNVGFMQIISPEQIRLRVFERGVGETLACGSGACAAVAVGKMQGLLADRVLVHLPGGQLLVYWQGDATSVWMTGPAKTVFTGEWTD
ncbi:MAG: diaminopimelate epimerase [Coxiellaceae bacterium]|nr:MAG: diaminopimelate epimerase [Coxiellaceae bacterium]